MRGASVAGTLAFMVWAKAARRPVDSFAIFAAFAASLTIVVNAVFLQSGPHAASVSMNPAPALSPAPELVGPKPTVSPPAATHSVEVTRTTPSVLGRRNDPIAQLIGQSSHALAVQRVLSEYGYGPIKPTGVVDTPTSQAIEQFEREHNLPVTGKISDGLLTQLAVMTGHPLQ